MCVSVCVRVSEYGRVCQYGRVYVSVHKSLFSPQTAALVSPVGGTPK